MRLNTREVDAVVDTVMLQISQKQENSPEMVEYERLKKLESKLEDDASKEIKAFKKSLVEKYSKISEGLEVSEGSYGNPISISSPKSPPNKVDKHIIQRELIVANISGNIEETMNKIVEKYTK